MPQIEENVKYTLEDMVTLKSLVEIAAIKQNDSLDNFYCFPNVDILHSMVYPVSNKDEMPGFYVWTDNFVYFPCQNDMGVKWVASVPRRALFVKTADVMKV
jgi:hypothetical protein